MAVCKRIATSRVYPKIPSCEIGDGAVGCCRISEVDEGAKGVRERERGEGGGGGGVRGAGGGGAGERSEHTCPELQAGRINGLTY